jgi:hypothetical protein
MRLSNSEWYAAGYLPLRSSLSTAPGHPPCEFRFPQFGLDTSQNTSRLHSSLSGGFWSALLANKTPRVQAGDPPSRSARSESSVTPQALWRSTQNWVTAANGQTDFPQRCSSLPGELESGRYTMSEDSAGSALERISDVSARAASAGGRNSFQHDSRSSFAKSL